MSIPKYPSNFVALMLFLTIVAGRSASAQEILDDKKILVLYHHTGSTLFRDQFNSGLRDYLTNVQDEFSNIVITNELLGLNKPNAAARIDTLVDTLTEDQLLNPASVVVSVLSPTADFLDEYGDEIYEGVPRVYVFADREPGGESDESSPANVQEIPNATPITIEETVESIQMLLPYLENLYIVSGVQEVDLEYVQMLSDFSNEILPNVQVNLISGLPVNELDARLSNLPENSAIFMLTYFMDRNNTPSSTLNVFRTIAVDASAPIFSYFGVLQSEGVVGGSVSDIELTGRLAGEMAVSMLSGAEINSDLMSTSVTAYRFDQRQLRRWGIDESLLPAGSIIEHQEPTFLDIYGRQLLILFAVVAAFLLFAFFLKRQSNRLGTQKTLFESVINSIPDAILITDTDSRIFATNKGAEKVFGFGQNKLFGMHTRELIDQSSSSHKIIRGRGDPLETSVEPTLLTYIRQSGKSFSGETIATKIVSDSGQILGHFALIRDVSKRLSLEEEQRQGQKMEALGNLVGGISHDFNNILGVISGYAELSISPDQNDAVGDNQSQILKATEKAKSLISQIMTFSRDTSIEKKLIDLNLLLDETLELVKVSIPSNIEIVVNKSERVYPVIGAAIQLQQIFLNLTTNAYQAMNAGGRLTISLERRHIEVEMNLSQGVLQPNKYVALSVSDTGSGMSADMAARVFEPYFTTRAQEKGSGLGLSIVYKLAKTNEAMLDLKTRKGKGTCITVYFKEVPDGISTSKTVNEIKPVRGRGERILLVDDEIDFLDANQRLLTSIGYQVTSFSDPIEALQAFREAPSEYDLLVSDHSMPNISGIQLLREIRGLGSTMPAIICSGYSNVINQEELEDIALSTVIRKPFRLAKLSEEIAEALSARQIVSG